MGPDEAFVHRGAALRAGRGGCVSRCERGSTNLLGSPVGGISDDGANGSAIGALFEVYNTLGFGFLEHVYLRALEIEGRRRGHRVGREVGVQIMYKGEDIAYQRMDLIVDDKLVIETKSTYRTICRNTLSRSVQSEESV